MLKKIVLQLTIVFLLLCGSVLTVCADSNAFISAESEGVDNSSLGDVTFSDFEYNGVKYSYPNTVLTNISTYSLDTVLVGGNSSYLYVFFYNEANIFIQYGFYVSSTSNPTYRPFFYFKTGKYGSCLTYSINSDGTLSLVKTQNDLVCFEINDPIWTSEKNTSIEAMTDLSSRTILYCNKDLYVTSGNNVGVCFFHLSPTMLGVEQEVLAAMIQPEMVLQEVVAVLPLTMIALVGWISLRKALQLLSRILHQS